MFFDFFDSLPVFHIKFTEVWFPWGTLWSFLLGSESSKHGNKKFGWKLTISSNSLLQEMQELHRCMNIMQRSGTWFVTKINAWTVPWHKIRQDFESHMNSLSFLAFMCLYACKCGRAMEVGLELLTTLALDFWRCHCQCWHKVDQGIPWAQFLCLIFHHNIVAVDLNFKSQEVKAYGTVWSQALQILYTF